MFKRMKLGTKMFAGFAVILVLLGVVAVFGYEGLQGVISGSEQSKHLTEIVSLLKNARQAEKNYIIRGEQSAVDQVTVLISGIKDQVAETRKILDDQQDQQRIAQIGPVLDQYTAAFQKYVDLTAQRKEVMKQMESQAATTLLKCEFIADTQTRALELVRYDASVLLEEKLGKIDLVDQFGQLMLQAEAKQAILLSGSGDDSALARWKEINQEAIGLAKDLKDGVTDPERIKQIDQVAAAYRQYNDALLAYLDSWASQEKIQLEKSITEAKKQLAVIRQTVKDDLEAVQEKNNQAMEARVTEANDAHRLSKWFLHARREEKEFIISADKKYIEDVNREVSAIKRLSGSLKSRLTSEDHRNQVGAIEAAVMEYDNLFSSYVDLMSRQDVAEQEMNTAARQAAEMCTSIDDSLKQAVDQRSSAAEVMIGISTLVALALGLLISWFLTRSITGPVRKIIDGLSDGASQVASAADQVSDASQTLAQGSSRQAASLENTASSMEEMAAMTNANANNANQATTLTQEAGAVIDKADQAMKELTQAIADISAAGEETGKIIKTIDEIAFQTNLLALNAAVEAARAGEAGAGFAVVADEVRNLAMRAAEAAKNTTGLIEQTINQTRRGSELVSRADGAFREVSENAGKVAGLIQEIASASSEQTQGIDLVNQAVNEMSKLTQANAANAEESAAASEELSAQSHTMLGHVDGLVVIVGASNDSPHRSLGLINKMRWKKQPKALPAPEQEAWDSSLLEDSSSSDDQDFRGQ